MVCIGPSDQRFLSRLSNLFDEQGLPPLNFISIRLENVIWTKFQVEGTCTRIVRLKAEILSLNSVDLCLELQSAALPAAQKEIADGLNSLGILADNRGTAAVQIRRHSGDCNERTLVIHYYVEKGRRGFCESLNGATTLSSIFPIRSAHGLKHLYPTRFSVA